jgi:hypothetical protein
MSALETFAAYTQAFQSDSGGGHLRIALLAAILSDRHQLHSTEAIDLARSMDRDERVCAAGDERDRLIDQARRAALAAEMGEEVQV